MLMMKKERILKVHFVYMGALTEWAYSPSSHHMLVCFKKSLIAGNSTSFSFIIKAIQGSFNGFAAYLTEQVRQKLLVSFEGVVSVFPSKTLRPKTTRSWDFMGFSQNVHRNPTVESDIIIGVIDSGIYSESESFSDKGSSPLPKKLKGVCNVGKKINCNK
ncbi:subtilisin-like protease SBT4.13 [Actinidia eriantha]|uniref:subtilisin-like protease SBT4.13 n=1 Tax=Actinidia eriantha TaxID=165200 RepID=UPI00258D0111|nr:subtilisin-like protease SBT4.13 [Actinidia eriantha]